MVAMPIAQDRRKAARGPLFEARRRYPRAPGRVEAYYETFERVAAEEAADLSLRGVFFATRRPDAVGTRGTVRLALPGHVRMVRAEVEVVRVAEHGMGLAFRSMSDPDRAILAAYLLRTIGLAALPQLERGFGELLRA